MKQENSFLKNTIWLTIGTILNKGLQFLAVLFFSRWLSTEEYGRFDLLYTYISLLIPLITLSTQEAVFRFSVNEGNEDIKCKNVSSAFLFDMVNYFVYLCIAFFIVGRINVILYLAFSFYLIAELWSVYLRGFLRAIKRLDIYAFALVLQTMFMLCSVTAFVYKLHMGLIGILLGYAVGTFIGDFILVIWGKWIKYFDVREISKKQIEKLISYSAPLVPNEVSWWVMTASDRQIINIFCGDAANGIFAITHKIPALCSVIFNMFAISWQQEIVTKVENNEDADVVGIFNKMLITLLSICWCLLAGSFVFYFYFFDIKYFEAILYSPILIASAAAMAISQFYGGIQAAYKRTKSTGVTTIVGAVLNIVVHLALIDEIGLYAAAVSTLVANIVIIILRMISIRDVFKIKMKKEASFNLLIFLYFFITAYFNRNMYFNWINFFVAILIAVFINYSLIKTMLFTLLQK
ncbi:lipopolysaccharide biosynthesis protein [Parablautia muri]|nr:oligosaccharide flippase family protein [Parablautia muri]